jgi:hypothetical protein
MHIMPAQTNPALSCATPLGLEAGAMGTQCRRSCLAPTRGFVVERRWRSMLPAFNVRSPRCREGTRAAGGRGVAAGVPGSLAPVLRTPRHLDGAANVKAPAPVPRTPRAFGQQRAGLASLRAYYPTTYENSYYLAHELYSGSIRKKTCYGILPCLLRPMHINPNGVAHDAGYLARLRRKTRCHTKKLVNLAASILRYLLKKRSLPI